MKTDCEKISRLITDKLAGELKPEDLKVLEEHLESCEKCRKEFEELSEFWTFTEQALKDEELPKSLEPEAYEKIFKTALNKDKKKGFIKFHWLELAASIFVVVVLLGMFLPAFSKMRENARKISCSSELKQIGLALKQDYSKEAKGKGIIAGVSSQFGDDQKLPESRLEPIIIVESEAPTGAWTEPQKPMPKPVPKVEIEEVVTEQRWGGGEPIRPELLSRQKKKAEWKALSAAKENKKSNQESEEVTCEIVDVKIPKTLNVSGKRNLAGIKLPKIKRCYKRKLERNDEGAIISKDGSVISKLRPIKKSGTDNDSIVDESIIIEDIADEKASGEKDYLAKNVKQIDECKPKIIKEKAVSESFHLNLKLWDLTSPEDVKIFFSRNRINLGDVDNITIDKDKNLLKITAPLSVLRNIGKVVEKLKSEEERLNEIKNGLPFIKTQNKPVSTFSIDADTASYTAARKKLRQGIRPEPESIRPEEFINYFDYHYPSPASNAFGVYLEAAPSPARNEAYTFRIGVQGKKLGPDKKRVSSFTILVDVSGSMAAKGRLDLVKKSLKMLMGQLKRDDKVSIIVCGDSAKTLVSGAFAYQKMFLDDAISQIKASGSTNLEKGIIAAYGMALKHYIPGGYNRVVIFTDGIVDTDSDNPEDILKKVAAARAKGVCNTIIAVGGDGDDRLMEALADRGDGNYVFLDSGEEAEELFKNQFEARFRVIAKDVKIQVEFNPEMVESYRQVGYENRQLSRADFRNDKVDAGEVGAGQSVTALYELRLTPGFRKNDAVIASVRLRYKNVPSLDVEEKEYYLDPVEVKKSFDDSKDNFRLAFVAGEFAEGLKYPDTPGIANPPLLKQILSAPLKNTYKNDRKAQELYKLINSVK